MLHELVALITDTEAALRRVNESGTCQQIKRKNAMNRIVVGYFCKPVHAQVKKEKGNGNFNSCNCEFISHNILYIRITIIVCLQI